MPRSGTADVMISRPDYQPEFQVDFDREKLALYGLNLSTAATYLRNRINGQLASRFREDGEEYDIKVMYEPESRTSIEDIENAGHPKDNEHTGECEQQRCHDNAGICVALELRGHYEMWRPMGTAVIGGLTFSTILTLLFVPVLYCVFAGQGIKKQRRKLRKLHANSSNR